MTHNPQQPNLEQKRGLLRELLKQRGGETISHFTAKPVFTLDNMPEIAAFEELLAHWATFGISDPCFRVHQGSSSSTALIEGRTYINYSSYNYVGLSGHPHVNSAAQEAIEHFGTSASASRLAAGERPVHRELEKELATFLGTEDALVFTAGHATNVVTIGHLFGPRDLVIHDELAHNSILHGCLLSGAHRLSFAHNNWQELDRILQQQRSTAEKVLIAIEGVYSVDGDIADLPRFIEVKKRHEGVLLVDEAHSIGVLGKRGAGIGEHFGVKREEVDLWMGTLSKSLASCGGYIAGKERIIRFLKYNAGGFVFSAGMSPPIAAAALCALRLMQKEPWRLHQLQENATYFLHTARSAGLNTGLSQGAAVVPVIVGSSPHALLLAQALDRRGIHVHAMVPPVVPEGQARLRFFLSACHTKQQIEETVAVLKEEWEHLSHPPNQSV